jgi:hypothetical protein
MRNGPKGIWFALDPTVAQRHSTRRRRECRRRMGIHARRNAARAIVVGLTALLAGPGLAKAQEPLVPPPIPAPDVMPARPHHWWNCLTANDGIPRTFSYYYTPWLNQPRHLRVVGPDGKKHWRSTVRGLPMGYQWLVP